MNRKFLDILWPAIAGLLAALLILDRWVLNGPTPVRSAAPVSSYAEAVGTATPSVVNIYTAKLVTQARSALLDDRVFQRFSQPQTERRRIERSLGSGVIMSTEGHILTNNHVISGADAIQILFHDGRSANASVIGSDSATDLAVLKVNLPDLTPIELADSDRARVGDVVMAIGNPLGFGHSVTQGIVSALGRYGLQLNTYEDYIQTDATIHLGNSGGALIDNRGRLLGINTLIYTAGETPNGVATGIGISLAIPVKLAEFVMRDLIQFGKVVRGWLGVSVDPINYLSAAGQPRQALRVAAVAADSPAQKAGLMVNDIITHIDGESIQDGRLTMYKIALLRPGDTVDIALARGEDKLEIRAVVGLMPQSSRS